ncbi:MAG: TadE/TadG family type IV pilus assembly protein [Amphiplicatus sp.]
MKRRCLGLARFAGEPKGAAAIEFAIVAPIFIALVLSILEAGYFFFVSSAVDQAAARAARLIRTGQAQSAATPISRDAFFDRVCDIVKHFGDCSTKLTVDVSRFSDFAALAADLSAPVCRDADEDAVNALPYNVGAERDIIRVRICYLYKPVNPALGLHLAAAPDGTRKMISVAIFRNEPFNS